MSERWISQEGLVDVDGGRVWYRISGVGQPGLPLLVVHGGPGACHDYLEPLEALAASRPVIFYDQLDCGNSIKTGNAELWTLERFCRELHQVRSTLGLERVHILGQSWGATLAVEYGLSQAAAGVASLVLSGPMLSSSRWAADQQKHLANFPLETQKVIRDSEAAGDFSSAAYQSAMQNYYQRHVCRLSPWPDCLNQAFDRLNAALYQYMWGPSEFTVTGTLKHYERVDRLNEIRIPVLFTCGAHDEASPDTIRIYQKMIPLSQIRIFDDASHEHHLEKTGEYLSATAEFLARVDQSINGN